MQGDVVDKVLVAGLNEEPITVLIVAHPCSMRRGSKLADRVAIAPIKLFGRVTEKTWSESSNLMPLPDLRSDSKDYMADLREITSIKSSELSADRRIATLSPDGLLILQQRFINVLTRFKVPVSDLAQQISPVLVETELQRDWTEAALDARAVDQEILDTIAGAEEEFHVWLDENDRERRVRLQQVHLHAQLRREARAEIATRYPAK